MQAQTRCGLRFRKRQRTPGRLRPLGSLPGTGSGGLAQPGSCLAQGATEIGWHCWSSNVASAATARKVGFEQTIEHPVYHAWYNRFDNLLVQGWFNLQYERYGAAAQAYEAAFALRDRGDEDALASHLYADEGTERWCHYNTACAWALIGDSQAAFRNLNKAVERGWVDMEYLERDERLKSLHETDEWRSFISNLSELKGSKR